MTQAHSKTQPTWPADNLERAIKLAKAGRKIEARDMLRGVVALQPVNQAAWLWLSALATDRDEAEAALSQARKINPSQPALHRAERWLAHRFSVRPPTKESVVLEASPHFASPPSAKSKNVMGLLNSFSFGIAVLAILVGLAVLFLGLVLEINANAKARSSYDLVWPDQTQGASLLEEYAPLLEEARARQDWTTAIAMLEELRRADPDSQPIKDQLASAYLQKGLTLRHKGFVEEAHPYFEQALEIMPKELQARQELRMAANYLAGAHHYQAGQWQEAINALEAVQIEDADYINVRDLLFSAYYNHGLALQAAGRLPQAREAFEAAIALRPDLAEPRRQIAEIEFALAPQTPLATPVHNTPVKDRLIVIGIAEQRMYVYEGDEKVFDFVVSTGEPGRDTAIGEFEVLDKIDLAYASTWNLDMPYWMGIYWAGPLENGIHALPTVKHTGYKLWDGYLGQRVSYGCIILGDEDAVTLYEWAEVGTKVKIVPSLANWRPE